MISGRTADRKLMGRKYTILILIILLCAASFISVSIGVSDFTWSGLFSLEETSVQLVYLSRIPRLMSILITGAGLAISGLIMQTITGNKFVSPTTAGTMEWSRLGVICAMILFTSATMITKITFAFIIALTGTMIFIRLLSHLRIKNTVVVPLIGMMMGNVISSITTYLGYKYDIIQNISSWLQGNFSLIIKGRYEILYIGIPFVIIAGLYTNRFTIAGMGKSMATNLGLNHDKIVFIGISISAFISAVIVVTVGSISYVGLIIPNIVAIYRGDNLHATLVETALLGALYVLICDIVGRIIIFPYEISISTVSAVLGSIIFLAILIYKKKGGAR